MSTTESLSLLASRTGTEADLGHNEMTGDVAVPPVIPTLNSQTLALPDSLQKAVTEHISVWTDGAKMRRLWTKDETLWTESGESTWLSWLTIIDEQLADPAHLTSFSGELQGQFSDVVLLGMGGSSLCPEVLRMTFGAIDGYPDLHVLDSTDPAQVKALEDAIEIEKTLFIVASKSGSTLEPSIFMSYYFDRLAAKIGKAAAANQFVAITDPGSKLEAEAKKLGFRKIFPGVPTIGGRYSALSNFGMVAGAAMGLDTVEFLERSRQMAVACSPYVRGASNPGLELGALLGVAAAQGRDKITFVASPGVSDLGAWLEQLIAESTGKQGKGIIPVDREAIGEADTYGQDRIFAYLRLDNEADAAQDAAVARLESAGHPVVRVGIRDRMNIGQEFFRWEIATAVAGAIMGINPFDQPDVEASKIATSALTDEYESAGSLPEELPFAEGSGLKLFADQTYATLLKEMAGGDAPEGLIKAHLDNVGDGDYVALLAYIHMTEAHEAALNESRSLVRASKRVATCVGFGPRFLHSTGQGYKGGPDSGVFLQITCDDAADLAVPGRKFTFGVVKAAQARGDFQVLTERHRRALRVHLGSDVAAGLATLNRAVSSAL